MQNQNDRAYHPNRPNRSEQKSMISYVDFMLSINLSRRTPATLTQELKSSFFEKEKLRTAEIFLAIGRYYLLRGDFKKSIRYFQKSEHKYRRNHDIQGLIFCIIGLFQAYNFLSDFNQVSRLSRELHDLMFQTDDLIAKAFIRLNMMEHAILNMRDQTLITEKILDMESDIEVICELCFCHKCWYLYTLANILLGYLKLERGDARRAASLLENAIEFIEKYNFPSAFANYAYHLLPEAYFLEYNEQEKRLTQAQADYFLNKIKQLCETALNKANDCLFHYGGALRSQAKYLMLKGRNEEAESFFLKSIDYCSKFGQKLELGLSFYFYSFLLGLTGRKEDALVKLHAARHLFREVGAAIYLKRIATLLGDREDSFSSGTMSYQANTLAMIINISRDLSAINTLEELAGRILDHALALSHAERGALFIHNEKNEPEIKAAIEVNADEVRQKMMNSRQAFHASHELYTPIKIGNQEIGLCWLGKIISSERFNGYDEGSVYLLMSQVSVLIENCRLNRILSQKKENGRCSISPATEKKIKNAISYIQANFSSDLSRDELARVVNMNADNFGRFFKQYTGCRISEYMNQVRMEHATRMLRETDEKVIDIAFSVGFASLTTFNRVFNSTLETTPSNYRKCNRKRY